MTTRALIEIGRQFGRVEETVQAINQAMRALTTVVDGGGPQGTPDDVIAACMREAVSLERGAQSLAREANRLAAVCGASQPTGESRQ